MKALILIVCCLIGTRSLKAQQIVYHPFPDVKAKWVVTTMKMESNMNIIFYDDQYAVKGDTLINSLRYIKFRAKGGYFLGSSWDIFYYRQDTLEQKIWIRDFGNNTDFLIYNFNWQIGDSVHFFDIYSNVACTHGVIYDVDSIIDEADSTYRKIFKLYNDENTTPGGTLFSEYTDGLGYNFGPNQAFFYTEGLILRYLSCFTTLSSDSCYETLSIKEPLIEKNQSISIFPNPSSQFLNIQTSFLFNKINIYTHLGQQLNSFNFPNYESNFIINIENLNNGIYLIQVCSTNEKFQNAIKFIKN